MRTTRWRSVLSYCALATVVLVGVVSCAGPELGDGRSTGVQPAEGEPVDGGVIEYGHEQEPPCAHAGWVQNAYLARQYLDNLVSLDDDGSVVSWLAKDWEISPDQKSYTFHLKPDVNFTDGMPLDAAAVKYNFDHYLKSEEPNSTVVAYLGPYYESGEVVDESTYRLNLRSPYSPLLTVLTQGYFGIQSPTALARGPEVNCTAPVGSGPFILQSWERNKAITFVRNPDYNSAPANARHQGPAYVDKVSWKFLEDPVLRYGSLTSGSSDVIYNVPVIDWAEASREFQLQRNVIGGRPNQISLNATQAPFDEEKVRQAFAWSANREKAVETAFRGVVPFNGNGALSAATPAFDPHTAAAYTYDPARADQLLDEAGWNERNESGVRTKAGKPLRISMVYPADAVIGPEGATVLQTVAHQAEQVGFEVDLIPATQSEHFGSKYTSADSYHAYVGYWTSPTPGVLLINWRQRWPDSPNPHNTAWYNDPHLQRVIEKANETLDPEAQRTYYAEAQRIIADKALSVGLYTQDISIGITPRLHDVWTEKSQGEPVFHDARFIR